MQTLLMDYIEMEGGPLVSCGTQKDEGGKYVDKGEKTT